MENEHVLSGMIKKRAELAGEIERAQTVFRQLVIDLDNLDAAIRLFDPDIDLTEIKPKPTTPVCRLSWRVFPYRAECPAGERAAHHAAASPVRHGPPWAQHADKRLVKTIGKACRLDHAPSTQQRVCEGLRKPGQCAVWELANEAQ